MIRRLIAFTAATCASAVLHAQPLQPATAAVAATAAAVLPDFSESSTKPSAAELAQRLNGQVYVATLANGDRWRMDYKSSSGYVFFNLSSGGRDTAKWRTEDGRVCMEFRGHFPSGCSEFRIAGERIFFKRASTGEVVAMERTL